MTDGSGGQTPGWYYAQGDPAGTHRYWDGGQWQGDPQAVVASGGAVASGGGGMAGSLKGPNMGDRFVAFLIDMGIVLAGVIAVLVVALILGAVSETLGGLVAILGYLAVLGFALYNALYLQGTTGQTIGKKMKNIKLVSRETEQPLGILGAFIRYLVSGVIATACYLDHWWIFVDENNQRLSDNVLGNKVVSA